MALQDQKRLELARQRLERRARRGNGFSPYAKTKLDALILEEDELRKLEISQTTKEKVD